MRLPRIPRIRKRKNDDNEFWDLSQEIDEVDEGIVEEEEAEYSEVLLSEPDEEGGEKIKGKEYVLPQFYLSHEEKKSVEEETFGDSEEKLEERSWGKRAKETLDEIEEVIDGGLAAAEEKEEIFEETQEPGEDGEFIESPEKIKGKIINREIVYETPGGYVVKVTSKEDDRVLISYYSVSKIDGIEQALDDLRKYKPVIEERETTVPVDNKIENIEKSTGGSEDKKSFFGGILGKK